MKTTIWHVDDIGINSSSHKYGEGKEQKLTKEYLVQSKQLWRRRIQAGCILAALIMLLQIPFREILWCKADLCYSGFINVNTVGNHNPSFDRVVMVPW